MQDYLKTRLKSQIFKQGPSKRIPEWVTCNGIAAREQTLKSAIVPREAIRNSVGTGKEIFIFSTIKSKGSFLPGKIAISSQHLPDLFQIFSEIYSVKETEMIWIHVFAKYDSRNSRDSSSLQVHDYKKLDTVLLSLNSNLGHKELLWYQRFAKYKIYNLFFKRKSIILQAKIREKQRRHRRPHRPEPVHTIDALLTQVKRCDQPQHSIVGLVSYILIVCSVHETNLPSRPLAQLVVHVSRTYRGITQDCTPQWKRQGWIERVHWKLSDADLQQHSLTSTCRNITTILLLNESMISHESVSSHKGHHFLIFPVYLPY